MMKLNELKKFVDMVILYDQVGEIKADEMRDIDTIINLSENDEFSAINSLYNQDEEFTTANEMMIECFGLNCKELNTLADEFGYQKVG